MLRVACDELEADLHDKGLWLGDLWTGRLTIRRVAVIASQLPPGSRVWQADLGDASWSRGDYWMATVIDEIRTNSWLTSNHGVESGKQSTRPETMDRPKDARERAAREVKLEANALKFRTAFRRRMESQDGD